MATNKLSRRKTYFSLLSLSRENLKIEFREKHQYSHSLPITYLTERHEESVLSYCFEVFHAD